MKKLLNIATLLTGILLIGTAYGQTNETMNTLNTPTENSSGIVEDNFNHPDNVLMSNEHQCSLFERNNSVPSICFTSEAPLILDNIRSNDQQKITTKKAKKATFNTHFQDIKGFPSSFSNPEVLLQEALS